MAFLLSSLVAATLMLYFPENGDLLAATANPLTYVTLLISHPLLVGFFALLILTWCGWPNILTGFLLFLAFQLFSAQFVFLMFTPMIKL